MIEKTQQAQNLRDQGFSYREIGSQLGVSKTTINRWLNPEFADSQRLAVKNWRLNNMDADRDKSYRWRQNHPEYRRQYENRRFREDIQFKLTKNLRNRLRDALKHSYKAGSAVSDLGCSIQELKQYLESQFQNNMTWDNYGQWHIDHIKPLASFDLTDREHFLEANNYTNLQPLWAEDNLRKSDKYELV